MKQLIFIIAFLLFIPFTGKSGNKTELKWNKFDVGIAEAKKSNKKILLDVYTDWCKWCKKLDAEVYTNEKVAKYLNQQYVVIKINAESSDNITYNGKKMSETELARLFGVSSYPTIIFLEPTGETIDKLGGFVDASKFLPIIKFIGEDHYKKMSWEEYKKKNETVEKIK